MNKASGDNFITLTWLNSLGNWEYWTFSSRHSYGYQITNVKEFKRDVFQDWDTEFINGQTQNETLSLDVANTITVRSQRLTKQQVNAISQIRKALIVQDASNGYMTVSINRGSFQYRTDKEKTLLLEFNITYPTSQTQTA